MASETDATLQTLRLAAVSYLNTAPLIEGVAKLRGVKLTLSAPSQLIGLLTGGDADMALASIIDYQRADADLAIVPAGIIGCDGPTLTVRVFSRVTFEAVTTLHADADSHTSVALAQIALHERTGRVPEVIAFDADAHAAERLREPAHPWPETLLMIGDKVVTDSPPAAVYLHQLDLGEAWKASTGLPFVYAAWMTKRDRAEDPAVRHAAQLLDRQRRHNQTRLDWIIEMHARKRGWPVDMAHKYLDTLLRYELTDDHRRAIALFFEKAAGLGIVPAMREPVYAEL